MKSDLKIKQYFLLLVCAALILTLLSTQIGSTGFSWQRLIDGLFASDTTVHTIFWQIRLPRVMLGFCVGALLSLSGVLVQGLFRNPLAEPGIIGVSSGATLSAMLIFILLPGVFAFLNQWLGQFTLPLLAFLGGLAATQLVLLIARKGPNINSTLILAGVAINVIASAGIGLASYLADGDQLRILVYWNLGSLNGAKWIEVLVCLFIISIIFPLAFREFKALNALLLGESQCRFLGFNYHHLKWRLIIMVALATGTAVAFTGVIGFIGLIVPHLSRALIGANHKYLIPFATVAGGLMLVCADIIARIIIMPSEVPIGIITALIGTPLFITMLMKGRTIG